MLAQATTPSADPAWMSFTVVALSGIVLYTLVNLFAYLRAANWDAVVKILLSVVVGFIFVEWMANTAMTKNFTPISDGPAIGDLDFGGLAMLAVGIGSIASTTAIFAKVFDRTQSAKVPSIIGGTGKPTGEVLPPD